MTLYQAALEVLRSFSRPLHYKKIAELARRKSLLEDAHSQRDDLAEAMRAELDQHGDDVVCPRPGVFALKDWAQPDAEQASPKAETTPTPAAQPTTPEPSAVDDEDSETGGRRRRRRRRRQTEQDATEASTEAAPRRRRRQRDSQAKDSQAKDSQAKDNAPQTTTPPPPSSEDTAAVKEPAPKAEAPPAPAHTAEATAPSTEDAAEPKRSKDNSAEDTPSQPPRRRRRRRRGNDNNAATNAAPEEATASPQPASPPTPPPAKAKSTSKPKPKAAKPKAAKPKADKPTDTGETHLAGEALADAVAEVLEQADQPRTARALANTLSTSTAKVSSESVVAAMVTSDATRLGHGQRPRFTQLTDHHWGRSLGRIDAQSRAIETAITQHADTLEQHTQAQLQTVLGQLPHAAVVELVLHWLERLNHAVDDVRRHANGDTTVVTRARTGLGQRAIALRVVAAEGALEPKAVTALRSTLHHFGAAQGWLVTRHDISSDAVEEAMTPNLAMITLFDGAHFAQALLHAGLGVQRTAVPLSFIDLDFFNNLKGQGA